MADSKTTPAKAEPLTSDEDEGGKHERTGGKAVASSDSRTGGAVTERAGYHEDNDGHVPNPYFQSGTVSTSDTAGYANNSVREVSPVFDEGRALAMEIASKAIDPEDPTPSELVVLPEGTITVSNTAKTADEGRADIERAVADLRANPVQVGTQGPEAQAAAEEGPVLRRGAVNKEQ